MHYWKRCCHGSTKHRKKVIDVEKLSRINLKEFCDLYPR